MNACRVIVLVGFALLVTDARAALEFVGYLKGTAHARFVLTNTDTRKTSVMLGLGEAFEGHKLVGFDPANEVLTVERDGEVLQLPLKAARVKFGKAPPPPVNSVSVRLAIAADGSLWTDERPVTFDTVELLFKDYGRNGNGLNVAVQLPSNPDEKIEEIVERIREAMRTSGAVKSSIRLQPAPGTKPPAGALPDAGKKKAPARP